MKRAPIAVGNLLALAFAIVAVSLIGGLPSAMAGQPLFWSGNGTTQGNAGVWSTTTANRWGTAAAGPYTLTWNNANDDSATFGGTVATVTVTGAVKANSIHLTNTAGVYTWSGTGTIELSSGIIATDVATANTGAQTFNRPITVTGGGNLIVQNNTTSSDSSVALAAAESYGDLRFTSTGSQLGRNQVLFNNLSAIGAAATVRMDRNGAQIGFGSTGIWDGQTFSNNIILNESNSSQANFTNHIGINASYDLDYAGTISSNGPANLRFAFGTSGGTGVINLKHAASYDGTTSFVNANATTHFAGTIRNDTGADNALPTTTRLIFGPTTLTAAAGAYDLNGHSQTITGISTSATPAAIGGVINTSANQGTLKINATATQPVYTGNIGVPWESLTANSGTISSVYKRGGSTYATNDNIAVELLASSDPAAVVSFNRVAGMTYTGGTAINGGILSVNNTSGSGTGSGNVTIGAGGTLRGTGIIAGNVLSSGTFSPGNSIGVITLDGTPIPSLSLQAGSYKYELNSTTAAADRTDVRGDLNITAGTVLDASDLGGTLLAMGTKFTLINYGGTWNGGTFSGHPNYDTSLVLGANRFQIIYNDTSGSGAFGTSGQAHWATLTAVPEASAFLTVGLGGIFAIAAVWMSKRLGINVLKA